MIDAGNPSHPTFSPALEKAWQQWHQFLQDKDPQKLSDLLAEEVVFHSPVVWTPQQGKAITILYLMAASQVLSQGFTYVRKMRDGQHWGLEFTCQVGEIQVKGIDLIALNAEGKIIDFEVMVRPLKAIQAVHAAMGEMLQKFKP
ncbi:MAG: nuclear transport factor 2 family protein [Microscillaceae bacterium]